MLYLKSLSGVHIEILVLQTLQGQIESRSRVARALLSLCERLMTNGGDSMETVAMESHSRTAEELERRVTDLQEEIHGIWLSSLEWQMTLEDAQINGNVILLCLHCNSLFVYIVILFCLHCNSFIFTLIGDFKYA